ncbi:MAG: hypothetical protein K1X55_01885 [Chitinophagales bacterium]|nr:hypothetical protein [Chitinophagales bacterium]
MWKIIETQPQTGIGYVKWSKGEKIVTSYNDKKVSENPTIEFDKLKKLSEKVYD